MNYKEALELGAELMDEEYNDFWYGSEDLDLSKPNDFEEGWEVDEIDLEEEAEAFSHEFPDYDDCKLMYLGGERNG